MRYIFCLICLFAITQQKIYAQDTKKQGINGTVVNEYSEPMAGVKVMVKDTKQAIFTDANGEIHVDTPPGTVR